MHYPYYPHPSLFEPNIETRKLWLNTRKSNTTKGGGLFETDGFSSDRNWFVIALTIEIIAFFLTIWGGFLKAYGTMSAKGYSYKILVLAIIASVLFVVLDYVGVLIHHKGVDDRARANSRLNFEKNPIRIGELKKNASKQLTVSQFFGFICILLSALLKISSLLILISFLKKLAPVIIIFYLIVMYIHIKHTGYFYFAWKTKRKIKSEFQTFQKENSSGLPSEYSAITHKTMFTSLFKLELNILSCLNDRVKIKLLPLGQNEILGSNQYELTSKGCLWDNDIVNVTSQVDQKFQKDLYAACVSLQHRQLGTAVTDIQEPNIIDEEEEVENE